MPTPLTLTPATPAALVLGGTATQQYPSSTTYPGPGAFPGVIPLSMATAGSNPLTLTPA